MSRVRGLLLERLGRQHAVLLTAEGDFVRVRLEGEPTASPGEEVWGELAGPVGQREGIPFLPAGWRRAAAVTALAFGAAGALFAAVYLRGWTAREGQGVASRSPVVGEAVADARSSPAGALQQVSAPAPSATVHIAERREAPRLSVAVEWREWVALSTHRLDDRGEEDELDLVEHLRRALVGGSSGTDGGSGVAPPGARPRTAPGTEAAAPAARPSPGGDPRSSGAEAVTILRLRADF